MAVIGHTWDNSFSGNLPATGQFTLVVSGYYTTDTGPFTITLTTTPITAATTDNTQVVCIECAMRAAGAAAAVTPANPSGNPVDLSFGYKNQACHCQAMQYGRQSH